MKKEMNNLVSKEMQIFIENSYNPIVITTSKLDKPHPKILYCNNAFERLSGYKFDEVYGKSPRILQGKKTQRRVLDHLRACLEKGEFFEGTTVNYKKDGAEYYVEWNISPIEKDGKLKYFMAIQRDVTEKVKEKVNEEIFKLSIQQAVEHVAITDLDGNYTFVNESYTKRSGYQKEELIGNNPSILKSGKHDSKFYDSLWINLEKDDPFDAVFINEHKNGTLYYDKQTITPIIVDGKKHGYLIVGRDISNELKNEMHLTNLALKDQLTNLYNRNGFERIISKVLLNHVKNNNDYTFVLADIDYFKSINDNYGHAIGDIVLKEFANLMHSRIRSTDYAFRWGGEEFLIILNTDVKNAYNIIDFLRNEIENYSFSSSIKLTASFGLSELKGANQSETILKSDKALYKAKNSGRNKVVISDE